MEPLICTECECDLTPEMDRVNNSLCDECFDWLLSCAQPPADDDAEQPAK